MSASIFNQRAAARTAIASIAVLVSACSGNGTTGTSETPSGAGIELPAEVSAVSVRNDAGSEVRVGSARRGTVMGALEGWLRAVREAALDLAEDSDYHTVKVRKFVDVKVLDVFSIITTVFDAMRQTHYDDPSNVGAGWYECLVAFRDDGEGGRTETNLQEWYVNSALAQEDGQTINRVKCKIKSLNGGDGSLELVRVQVDIREAPTKNSDGTLADLGEWEIRALFQDLDEEDGDADAANVAARAHDENGEYFHATATVLEGGLSRLTVEDHFTETAPDGGEFTAGTRAVIFRSLDEGYGVIEVPDWDACFGGPDGPGPGCEDGPPIVTIDFAYNENYLTVAREGEEPISFDRTDEHEIVYRYLVFDAEGRNVERTKDFGFPVQIEGSPFFGWYGAWQDHHELWIPGDPVPDGSQVVRGDFRPGDEPLSYTVRRFPGALTKISLVRGSVSQVEGIPAEVYLFNDFRLVWNDELDRWEKCTGVSENGGCRDLSDFTSKLDTLDHGNRSDAKHVFINGCVDRGEGGFECSEVVYLADEPGPGFFVARFNDETGQLEPEGEPIDPEGALHAELFVSIGGRTYIEYNGDFDGPTTSTGWVEKQLTDFDESTWTPVFDDEGDRAFAFDVGEEHFINNRGTNLRVRRVAETGAPSDFEVYMEAQTVAKPSDDLAEIYPDGTLLVDPWDPEFSSRYRLVTDPENENYLLLVYDEVNEQDATDGFASGDVVSNKDIWGLRVEGDDRDFSHATTFNWEYQGQDQSWGGVTYLLDEAGDWVLLSDPLRFDPIALPRTDDIVHDRPEEEWITYSLMYDGFLHGLPDTAFELQKVRHRGDRLPSILANNIRIPDGTELVAGSNTYYTKAVDVGIFLGYVDAFPNGPEPNLDLADEIELDEVLPDFEAPDVDAEIPGDAELRYIEGVPVE